MDLHTWLDMPEHKGKAVELAAYLGRSKTAVSLWREQGVPILLFGAIEKFTNGKVTADAMLAHAIACKLARQQPQKAAA